MNKILQDIITRAKAIYQTVPAKREELLNSRDTAAEDAKIAEERKMNALTESEFVEASNAEIVANNRVRFYEKKLNEYDSCGRMTEEEYKSCVSAIEEHATKCAKDFRKTVYPAMDAILTAFGKYYEEMADCDTATETLDRAANILQNKYRLRPVHLLNEPTRYNRDIKYWRKFQKQYLDGDHPIAFNAATTPDDGEDMDPEILLAAWYAVTKSKFAPVKDVRHIIW